MNRGWRSLCLAATFSVAAFAGPPDVPVDRSGCEAVYRGTLPVAKFDISPPLRDIPPKPFSVDVGHPDPGRNVPTGNDSVDTVVQATVGSGEIPSPLGGFTAFNGFANPPDPVGDVGPNHYVAMGNSKFAVYDKAGAPLYGPVSINTLFTGFGGQCEAQNCGDPVVLYDQLTDRWLLTQFTCSGATYYNCVALSTSGDPTGTYYRWAFTTGANFPDYPKYGVWDDAYHISTREFGGGPQVGIGAYACNKAQMVAGNPNPTVISFLQPNSENVGNGILPADIDGIVPPPAGSPAIYMGNMDDGFGASQDALSIFRFDADFVTPANSTFTLATTLPTAPFDSNYPCGGSGRACIPQPTTTNRVDVLSYRQRPMFRLAYRNFGTHESLVTNRSVEAAPTIAGIRWFEVRDPNGTPLLYQEGTYAPGVTDGIHRWMGSIAMDRNGNMALGYSASDATATFPSLWYTGRLVTDPLGMMSQGEGHFFDGTGSSTSGERWGDYTSMNIDPTDDCTFWYVNEFYPTNGTQWRLRVGSFKYPSCGCSATIVVNPATLPSGSVGVPYNQTVTASGGTAPYTYAVTAGALPTGLTLGPTTGVISGTPAVAGPFNFTITAIDATGCSGSRAYTITIDNCSLVITTTTLADGDEGLAYNATVATTGGTPPLTFTVTCGTLPAGLTLGASTGVISGTPTTAAISTFCVTVTDSTTCSRTATLDLVIAPAVDVIVGKGLGQPNDNQVVAFTRDGSTTPVSFAAYGAGQWGTNVTSGDINGATYGELVTGPGPGDVFGPHVRAFDRTGVPMAKVSYYAYGTLKYGVNVASGNIEADPFAEIVTGAGPGDVFGPHVRGWNFDATTISPMSKVNFFAYATLKYGANVEEGDLDADGFSEILTGGGPGPIFAPTVRGWNYDATSLTAIAKINYNAFTVNQYGVNVAGGDMDGEGHADITSTPGPGAGASFPSRFVGHSFASGSIVPMSGFDATLFTSTLYGGRVGSGDTEGDGSWLLIAAPGRDPAAGATVETHSYNGSGLTLVDSYTAFTSSTFGANVGAGALGHY